MIGPFSAVPFCRIDSSTCSGSGLPSFSSITSVPACWTSHSNSTPVASSTRRVASVELGAGAVAGNQGHAMRHRRRTLPTVRRSRVAGNVRPRCQARRSPSQLSGVSVAETSICSIDPDAGRAHVPRLRHRRPRRARRATRRSPTCCSRASCRPATSWAAFRERAGRRAELPPAVTTIVDGNAMDAVADGDAAHGRLARSPSPTRPRTRSTARASAARPCALIAQLPTIVARYERRAPRRAGRRAGPVARLRRELPRDAARRGADARTRRARSRSR